MNSDESLPRRNFIKKASAASVAGAAMMATNPTEAAHSLSLSGTMPAFDTKNASLAEFTKQIGETFRAYPDGGSAIDLELIEVQDRSQGMQIPAQFRKPLLLTFRGPKNATFEQGQCLTKHHRLGQFQLFLVPNEHEQDSRIFSAVLS